MTTLAVHLEQLDAWLAALPGAPAWTGHLIAERAHVIAREGGRPTLVTPAPPQPATEYAARFGELLHAGYPWINLHGAGVVDGRLLVGVDFPQPAGVPAGRTSVNLSGPTRAVQARDGWAIGVKPASR